ncbi:MAG: DUF2919 family protein [Pseudomonadota bacterium]
MSSNTIYSPHRYDKHFRLKTPFLLLLVMLYGLRHVAALWSPGLQFSGGEWVKLLGDWRLVAPDVLVVLVLLAAGHRVANAHRYMRQLWHMGRVLLLVAYGTSALLFMGIHRKLLLSVSDANFVLAAATLVLDAVIIFYLARSRLLQDVFADFPDETDSVVSKVLPPQSGDVKPDSLAEQLQTEVMAGSSALVMAALAAKNPEQAMDVAARYAANNDTGEAEQTYRRLLETWPGFAPAWHELGLLAVRANKLSQAAVLVRQAANLDGENALYQRNMGEIFRRLGRLAEAIHAGQAATALKPDDADAHFNLALALADARRTTEAIDSYRATLHLNVAHGQAWSNIGVLLRQQGTHAAAKFAFEQALIVNPRHAEALSNIKFYTQKNE